MNADAVKSRRGFSLAAALLYVAIITVAIASVTGLLLTEYRITRDATARTQALYAAEAGIELALAEFDKAAREVPAWSGWTSNATTFCLESAPAVLARESTHRPELRVTADTASLQITANGRALSPGRSVIVSRVVVATLRRDGKAYAIQSWQEQ